MKIVILDCTNVRMDGSERNVIETMKEIVKGSGDLYSLCHVSHEPYCAKYFRKNLAIIPDGDPPDYIRRYIAEIVRDVSSTIQPLEAVKIVTFHRVISSRLDMLTALLPGVQLEILHWSDYYKSSSYYQANLQKFQWPVNYIPLNEAVNLLVSAVSKYIQRKSTPPSLTDLRMYLEIEDDRFAKSSSTASSTPGLITALVAEAESRGVIAREGDQYDPNPKVNLTNHQPNYLRWNDDSSFTNTAEFKSKMVYSTDIIPSKEVGNLEPPIEFNSSKEGDLPEFSIASKRDSVEDVLITNNDSRSISKTNSEGKSRTRKRKTDFERALGSLKLGPFTYHRRKCLMAWGDEIEKGAKPADAYDTSIIAYSEKIEEGMLESGKQQEEIDRWPYGKFRQSMGNMLELCSDMAKDLITGNNVRIDITNHAQGSVKLKSDWIDQIEKEMIFMLIARRNDVHFTMSDVDAISGTMYHKDGLKPSVQAKVWKVIEQFIEQGRLYQDSDKVLHVKDDDRDTLSSVPSSHLKLMTTTEV